MNSSSVMIAVFGLFGILYGVILQRSNFCFARATFELFLSRSREALNGVLVGLAVGTLGFAAVTVVRLRLGLPTEGHLLLLPYGLGTLLGAAIFGLGMSLAGMCVVGSLVRIGEGYLVGGLALIGAAAGAALDPFRAFLPMGQPPWLLHNAAGESFANRLGLPAAALLTLAALAVIWLLAARTAGPRADRGARISLRELASPLVVGGALLAVLNTVQMAVYQPWTIAYPLGVVAAAAAGQFSPSLFSRALPLLVLDGGVVLGAAMSALAGRELRLRWPRQRRQVGMSLIGGVLMGWGVQLAHGCNIGGLFSALPSLSLSAWLFLPGLFAGAWLGSLILRRVS